MIYIYAFVDSAASIPADIRGLEDQPLQITAVEGVAAIYTQHAAAIPPLAPNLWQHEKVVESFMNGGYAAVLPARFSTTVAELHELKEILTRYQTPLTRGLEKVRGCVEVGLRVASRSGPLPPSTLISATSGRDYMSLRLNRERQQRDAEQSALQIASEFNEALAPMVRDSVPGRSSGSPHLLSTAYLVPADRVEELTTRIRALAATYPAWQILCTGPWPAYHFAPSLTAVEAKHV